MTSKEKAKVISFIEEECIKRGISKENKILVSQKVNAWLNDEKRTLKPGASLQGLAAALVMDAADKAGII